jgi:tRNA-dihydrouridine synthase A
MMEPDLVRACLERMQEASTAEVTVKCRIGVDDQVVEDSLPEFLSMIERTGVTRVIIHARKAWLQGLSPKENRDIPPLDYDLVFRMKQMFPGLHLSLNGGVAHLSDACAHLEAGCDGVMIGRAAYQTPYEILARADCDVFRSGTAQPQEAQSIAEQMIPYMEAHLQQGGRLHQITRHMFGLFSGQPGARHWRRHLSELGAQQNAQIADYRLLLEERAALSKRQEELDLI